ncbi:hypothetical protein [Roseateles sp. MS654]|uniref:hypothetical protein n=1 Tax=Roseateles sp. MS654 TaxID=3412685 RepID=UPI003C2BE75A
MENANEAMLPFLEENYLVRCLDLNVMPDSVFGYYADVFAQFLFCRNVNGDRFGVLLGALLDAPSDRLDFWRSNPTLLQRISDRVGVSDMNEENKAELTEELGKIRLRVLQL